ncbi:carbohydrate porin [Rhodoferax lacus]|nr:carbohydrate porin [Rhodoferax lacus]
MNQSSRFAVRATSVAVFLAMGTAAYAAPNVDANIELDSTYNSGSQLGSAGTGMSQSGRLELNVSQKAGTDYFVAGRATLLAKKDGSAGTDDLWVQLGSASADVKLGRFEAADLFPIAQDTVVNHAGNVYGTNLLRGRSEKFHAALSVNGGSTLKFELGLIDATDAALGTGAKGVRPVVMFSSGAFGFKVGAESGQYGVSGNKIEGMGFTGNYSANGMAVNLNYAQGKQDAAADNKMTSMAINGQVGAFALGFVSAKNDQTGGDKQVQTVHASYSIPLFGVAGASITPAISHSTLKDSVLGTNQDVDAFRVRLHYDF